MAGLLALGAFAPATLATSGARGALVIGNADYPQAPLRSPVNDAREVAAALQRLGFVVARHQNLDLARMRAVLREWLVESRTWALRLVYYAGHGLQLRGRNYLVPVDAVLRNEDDIRSRTADATELVEQLGAVPTGANVVIIDACRVHPSFDTRRLWQAKPSLAPIRAPTGTLVAFSTRPGAVAFDGTGRLGIYARHLVATIGEAPALPVEVVFKRVREAVAAETRRAQVPWETSDLDGELCLLPQPDGRCGRRD